jgi:Trk K+ transport system NAD-binding subunit
MAPFERRHAYREEDLDEAATARDYDFIIFGLGRYGSRVIEILQDYGWSPLGIDFDPQALRTWEERGLPIAYGDAHDPHIPEVLPLERVRWIVSTVRDLDTNMALVQALRQHGYQGKIAVTALSDEEHHRLLEAGAEKVLPIRAVLNGRFLDTLVVDEETAGAVLESMEPMQNVA